MKTQMCDLNKAADLWLESRKNELKRTTMACYSYDLRKYIRPVLGKLRVDRIDTAALGDFSGGLKEQGLSAQSINRILTILRMVLNYAEQEQLAPVTQRKIRRVRMKPKRVRILSLEERKRLETYLLRKDCPQTSGVRAGIFLSLYTGLRIGEVCALTWSNIDLRRETLTVEKTLTRIYVMDGSSRAKTRVECGDAKTENSARTIPIPAFLKRFLIRYCDIPRTVNGGSGIFVLSGTTKPMEPRAYQNKFREVLEGAGLDRINYHMLRHTFATTCIEKGFDVKALSEILGHGSVKTTMDLYVHPTMDMKTDYMNRLEPMVDFGDYDEYGGGAERAEEMTRAEAEEWAEKASRTEEVKWEEHVVTLSLPGRKYNVGR